jgi:hypothetical protein
MQQQQPASVTSSHNCSPRTPRSLSTDGESSDDNNNSNANNANNTAQQDEFTTVSYSTSMHTFMYTRYAHVSMLIHTLSHHHTIMSC